MTKHKYITDAEHYRHPDSGCPAATRLLEHKSTCLKCPFPECLYISHPSSGRKIIKVGKGEEVSDYIS